jgi:hypothetical protein
MLPRPTDTDAFWQAFRRHVGLDHDNYVVGSFGNSSEMTRELADLGDGRDQKGHCEEWAMVTASGYAPSNCRM